MEEQSIYVGPNIAKFGLRRNEVYLGGLPGHIKVLLIEHPELEQLIVPISEASIALDEVRTKGTHIHHAAQVLRDKAGV